MERSLRLRRASEIRRVYDEGRSWSHPLLAVVARPNGLAYTRLGFAASRSVGSAVVRNRARRLLREAARHLLPALAPGWDIMLIARAQIRGTCEQQVEGALSALLRRSELARPVGAGEEGLA